MKFEEYYEIGFKLKIPIVEIRRLLCLAVI